MNKRRKTNPVTVDCFGFFLPHLLSEQTDSCANGISSCVFPFPTDKAIVVEGNLCKKKHKKPNQTNHPFNPPTSSSDKRQHKVEMDFLYQVLLRISEVLCCISWDMPGDVRGKQKWILSYRDIQSDSSGFPQRGFQHKKLHMFRTLT